MPLHDWAELDGWEGVHLFWLTELARHVKQRLPAGYRAYLGTVPALAVGAPPPKPDVSIRTAVPRPPDAGPAQPGAEGPEPDVELAVTTLDPSSALFVEGEGRLVAALELVSPRNKDRPSARQGQTTRYASYLLSGINLMLVDLHPHPLGFSFADRIAEALKIQRPPLPAPLAASYRVGEPAAEGGRYVALWQRALSAGSALPMLPLPLNVHQSVWVDLEATYVKAAADAYLA